MEQGIINKALNKWGIIDNPHCDRWGATEQTIDHLISECPPTYFTSPLKEIHVLTP